jgi:hypothetical protein
MNVITVGIISPAAVTYCDHETVAVMPIRVAVLENGRTKSSERSMESLRRDSTKETGDVQDLYECRGQHGLKAMDASLGAHEPTSPRPKR